ncbi:Uma2 domain-containing protein [Gammaproteobacteria bacterium]
MLWEEICADPSLQNLPYKIELNREGLILMSPAKNRHAIRQGRIQRILFYLMGEVGEVFPECPIQTEEGVKVADVVWVSPERYQAISKQDICLIAPEICIEVLSDSNTTREMQSKIHQYLAVGAQEVWICDNAGRMQFFSAAGWMVTSQLTPDFPSSISID